MHWAWRCQETGGRPVEKVQEWTADEKWLTRSGMRGKNKKRRRGYQGGSAH